MLSVLATPRLTTLLVLIFGVVVTTTEFRHGTATAAFLATPRRHRVPAAKFAAAALVGASYAAVAFAAGPRRDSAVAGCLVSAVA